MSSVDVVPKIADEVVALILDRCELWSMSNTEIDAVILTTVVALLDNISTACEMPEVRIDEDGERL